MNTFVVDLGHFQVKSGAVTNKGAASRTRGGGNASAAAKAKSQPVMAVSPNVCLDPNTGMIDANLAQQQIGNLLEGGGSSSGAAETAGGGSRTALDAKESTLVMTVDIATPRRIKEALVASFFETLGVASFHMGYSSVTSLYATGGTSGVVVDVGHFTSRVVPVQDGQPILEHMHTTQLGGYAQTMHLQTQLTAAADGRLPLLDQQQLHNIKAGKGRAHAKGRASNNNAAAGMTQGVAMTQGGATQAGGEGGGADPISLTLPDGSIVSVPYSSELGYELGDVLLNPRPLVSTFYIAAGCSVKNAKNSAQFPHYSLLSGEAGVGAVALSCLETLRAANPHCCESYLLCGGPSMMLGVADAVKHTLTSSTVMPEGSPMAIALGDRGRLRQPKQRVASDRIACSWQGTTLLAQLGSFNTYKVSRKTYNEEGPAGVLPLFHTNQL